MLMKEGDPRLNHWILKAQTPDMNLQPTSPMSRRMFLATDEVHIKQSAHVRTKEGHPAPGVLLYKQNQHNNNTFLHLAVLCHHLQNRIWSHFDPTFISVSNISLSFRLFPMKFAGSAWAGRRRPKTWQQQWFAPGSHGIPGANHLTKEVKVYHICTSENSWLGSTMWTDMITWLDTNWEKWCYLEPIDANCLWVLGTYTYWVIFMLVATVPGSKPLKHWRSCNSSVKFCLRSVPRIQGNFQKCSAFHHPKYLLQHHQPSSHCQILWPL